MEKCNGNNCVSLEEHQIVLAWFKFKIVLFFIMGFGFGMFITGIVFLLTK